MFRSRKPSEQVFQITDPAERMRPQRDLLFVDSGVGVLGSLLHRDQFGSKICPSDIGPLVQKKCLGEGWLAEAH